MASAALSRLTTNLFALALEDFEESLFTGMFRLVKVDPASTVPRTARFFDGLCTRDFQFNPKVKFRDESIIENSFYIVKFHHAFKSADNLLLIDRLTPFQSEQTDLFQTDISEPIHPTNFFVKNDIHPPNSHTVEPRIKEPADNYAILNSQMQLANNHNSLLGRRDKPEAVEIELQRINIDQLNLDLKHYMFKGKIIEKSKLKKYAKSADYFFDIHVSDETGTVRIVFWKDTYSSYFDFLHEQVDYWFSDFVIKPESKFNKTSVKYELYASLDSKTEEMTGELPSFAKRELQPTVAHNHEQSNPTSSAAKDRDPQHSRPSEATRQASEQPNSIRQAKAMQNGSLVDIQAKLRKRFYGESRLIGKPGDTKSFFLEFEEGQETIQIELNAEAIDDRLLVPGFIYSVRKARIGSQDQKRLLIFEPLYTVIEKTTDPKNQNERHGYWH